MSAKAFERYARIVWPLQRKFISTELASRCKRCAMSGNITEISKAGYCAECRNYTPERKHKVRKGAREDFSNRMVLLEEETNMEYHAVLLVSGGKDSAWLTHYMRTCFPKLNILCLLVDNGFLPQQAVDNAQFITTKMNYDLITIRPTVFREAFKTAVREAVTKGSYGCIDYTDGSIIHDTGRTLAAKMGIPYLISGVSWAQVEDIFGVDDFIMPQEKEETETPWWKPQNYENIPHFIFPYYLFSKSEEEILNDVKRLKLIPDGNVLLTNSKLITLMSVIDNINHGASTFEPEFCKMIRQGKADRKTWDRIFSLAEYCSKTGFLFKGDVRTILDQLEIHPLDLNINWMKK